VLRWVLRWVLRLLPSDILLAANVEETSDQGERLSETLMIPSVSPLLVSEQKDQSAAYGWSVVVPTIFAVRALVFVVGVIAVQTVHSLSQVQPLNASGFPWLAYDAHFYRYILQYGYPAGPVIPYQIAYFPLYPIASRALLPLFQAFARPQLAAHLALVVFANACSLIGLFIVYAWARQITSARTAFIATVLMAVYPSSVFFCAAYSEAPFMMFAAWGLYLLQKQRLYAAAAVSAVATALRPTAVSLAITVVLWTIYYSWNMPKGRLALRVLLIGLLSVAGAASYEGYLWHRYHRYDAFKVAEDRWDLGESNQWPADSPLLKGVDEPWSSAAVTAPPVAVEVRAEAAQAQIQSQAAQPEVKRYSIPFFIDRLTRTSAWNRIFALALLLVMAVAMFRTTAVPKVAMALPLIIFIMAYLPNMGLRASSIYRYESAGIPVFVVMAIWLSAPRRRRLLLAVGGISLAAQLYYAFLFCRGFWIG
jgi:hypothetical protein